MSRCWYSKDNGVTNSTSVAARTNFTTITSTEGSNTWKVYCNDTNNNIGSASKTFVKDTVVPSINLTRSFANRTNLGITVTITDASSGFNGSCTATRGTVTGTSSPVSVNEGSLLCDTSYEYNVTCYDYAGNLGSTLQSFSTESCHASSGSTYSASSDQLVSGVAKELTISDKFKILVNGQPHLVVVDKIDVSNKQATINVSSNPQQKVMSVGDIWKVNLDGDNYYDLLVKLNSLSTSRANVTITRIQEMIVSPVAANPTPAPVVSTPVVEEEKPVVATQTPAVNPEVAEKSFWSLTNIIIILVVLIILVWIFVALRKKN
jgi:hypothetical protein